MTTIYIKAGGAPRWSNPILKADRPIETVDMDQSVRADLLKDIEQYLHPTARRSYGRRGIPYRRGYLFYGPPGAGKTSMCFALAGHFKLELYSISGQGLHDAALSILFSMLPPKCIGLIEDVDSAGITRENMNASEQKEDGKSKKGKKSQEKENRVHAQFDEDDVFDPGFGPRAARLPPVSP